MNVSIKKNNLPFAVTMVPSRRRRRIILESTSDRPEAQYNLKLAVDIWEKKYVRMLESKLCQLVGDSNINILGSKNGIVFET